ncbi:pseudouridine synthase [Salinispirillum sp. LH 10-3-1]|uniref:Pseudouridine synthase n=1 Tax=Salinispirillum sp. LH 10-3-1 TaxID=2952525 RepID=A0AB38YF45_9GAMM
MTASIVTLFEHPDWLAVYKPSGVPVQDTDEQRGVLRLMPAGEQLHLVHRLDQGTSGVLLLARSAAAAEQFRQLFTSRAVAKYYWAVTARKPSKKEGLVMGDQVKARQGSWKLSAGRTNPARTYFKSAGLGNGQRAILLRPITGKTHQIRVAMKALGAPLLGDTRYGGAAAPRLYLHAYQLSFLWQGTPFKITADIGPQDWTMIEQWPKDWLHPETLAWPLD